MIDEKKEFLKHKKEVRSKDYLVKSSRWMLINLMPKVKNGTVSISDITGLISTGAFYFVLLLFVFPVALPLPYPPGFPSICGVPVFLLSLQMLINKNEVLLPKFVKEYRVKIDLIKFIVTKSNKMFKILSKFIKAGRMEFLASKKLTILYGIFFVVLSICILIPFPGTNFLPAVSIFLFCLGLLFADGILIIIAGVIGVLGLLIVYLLSAYFTALFGKIIHLAYTKFSSFHVSETIVAFIAGIFIGMLTMFVVMLISEILLKKLYRKIKIKKLKSK